MIIKTADRISSVEEYYFSKKLKEISKLKVEGKTIINLGIGSPDLMPPASAIEKIVNSARKTGVHGYQPYQGIPELKRAIVEFSRRRLNIQLDEPEILPLMGSKEGITHISLAYLNPEDKVLIPSISYPTYTSVTKMVGAQPVYFPLIEEKGWEPDWDFLEEQEDPSIKILWLNYPHMPTGTRGSKELLEKFVKLAKKKGWLICHDNPYSFILNDSPLSILSIEGAKDVAIELNSLSKTFNMAGWRVGWIGGKSEYLNPVLRIKSNMDSGMFRPIQEAACTALHADDQWFSDLIKTYSKRRNIVFDILRKIGCYFNESQLGMFVWARSPNGDGNEFADEILDKFEVFVAPGSIFGEAGKPFIRVSLCSPEEELKEVMKRVS